MMKPRRPFQEPEMYTPSEERTLLHEGIATLPDREGYFWLKTKCPEAVRMKTETLNFGEDFDEVVAEMKATPEFGYRMASKDYQKEEPADVRDVFRDMEESYPDRTVKKNP